jgi:dTMP kinase
MSGYFVILEGADGTGKTTQIKLLDLWLQFQGVQTYVTRAPGGHTVYGPFIREILLNAKDQVNDLTELFGQNFDKAIHIEQQVIPHLEAGTTVLCDRLFASTLVYQGIIKNQIHLTQQMNHLFWTKNGPLTKYIPMMNEIILHTTDKTAIVRQEQRAESLAGINDKYEIAGDDFKQRIRTAYRDLGALTTSPPYKRVWISSEGSIEEVQLRLQNYLKGIMHL